VWSIKAEDHGDIIARGYRRSAASTLLNHIANCSLYDVDISLAAFNSPSARKLTGSSPNRPRRVGKGLQMTLAQSVLGQASSSQLGGSMPMLPGTEVTVPSLLSSNTPYMPPFVPTPPLSIQASPPLLRQSQAIPALHQSLPRSIKFLAQVVVRTVARHLLKVVLI
jgi:hypothetical protein